jgi:Protein of unknown function (DUF3343)
MQKTIILFHSTHDAIRAERTCLQKGMSCQAIPVPRDLSAECGIALEVDRENVTEVMSILEKEGISAHYHERQ